MFLKGKVCWRICHCVSHVARLALESRIGSQIFGSLMKAWYMNSNGSYMVSRRSCLHAGLAAGFFSASVLPAVAQTLPEVQNDIWRDAERMRELPVLLRWPAGRPLGVMVYSHGLGGKKEGADFWGKAWATAGLLVVHLQHPGSDAASLKGGYSALRKAMQFEQMVARMQDVRFAIAELGRRRASGSGLWSDVPVDILAVGGHSFGARTTLTTAGWQRGGASGADPLPKAFVAMSPALGKDVNLAQGRQELASATRPFLVCTGSLDGEILGNGETPESRRMVFDALPAGKKALIWLDGADHFTFAGNEKRIPSTMIARRESVSLDAEAQHHERVARISTAWLKEQLLGQAMGVVSGLGASDQFLRA
jgi:predicted dienelactone hydrolase